MPADDRAQGFRSWHRWRRLRLSVTLALPVCSALVSAAEVDVSKLPPPATNRIDFARDIQPILEKSCLRCHGPERPKNHFRLDSRTSALKGGENGVDLIPGQSAQSPLIHNVAGLVEDLRMPPKGKGEALTAEQIGRLRAWIDQGIPWATNGAVAAQQQQFSISPTVQWITVSGDKQKFRDRLWTQEGWGGGAEEFRYKEKLGDDSFLSLEGHALTGQHDYRIALSVEKNDVGFTRFGFEQFRKYFDDSGGYYAPFGTPSFALGRDLHEDIGRAWSEIGLTLPDWPRVVVGYEYQFRTGSESLLQWGPVADASGKTKNIYPAYQDVDERTHIIKLDATHEIKGVQLEDNFRAEFYGLSTHRFNDAAMTVGQTAPGTTVLVDEGYHHFQANNTFRLEKQINPWLYLSGGHFYNRLDGDAAFSQSTLLTPGGGLFPYTWSDSIVLDQETHVFNANALLGPWAGLNGFAGLQTEWTAQHGLGHAQIDDGDPTDPTSFLVQPGTLSSDLGTFRTEENFGLRYTQIPCTALFADVRFQQESVGQSELEQGDNGAILGHAFIRGTEAISDLKEYRAGFEVSPFQRVSFNAQYLRREKKTDYNNVVDLAFGFPEAGYPAFITARNTSTDEVDAKLAVRPASWLQTTFTYKIIATDYHTATDPVSGFDPAKGAVVPGYISPGGSILAGNYNAQVYSMNAVLTPWRRLYLSSTLSYQDSRTATTGYNVPYRGDIYSVINSANFAINPATDLRATYSYSRADYGQSNAAAGLPLGLAYDWHGVQIGVGRRFKKNLSFNLQYAFYYYDEPTSGGVNNFRAHAIFAMLSKKLP
ncbi:MAG: c-type cytochrome domain-containing protein [Limisphaerales bacterium]